MLLLLLNAQAFAGLLSNQTVLVGSFCFIEIIEEEKLMVADCYSDRRLPRWFLFFGLFSSMLFFGHGNAHAGFLYLLNDNSAGSQIFGFSVNESTGALTALSGFPVMPGNGGINSIVSERMVADRSNNRLYVINDTSDSVSAYSVDPVSGALTPMPFSPIALGTGSWNTIAVHPSGSPMIVTHNASTGGARSFNITPTTATEATGSGFPLGGPTAFSSTFSRDGNYFYAGGNTGTTIAGFGVDTSTGILTTLAGSPFAAGGTSCIAYATDDVGRLFAVDNTFFVRVFTSANGALSPVAGNPFTSGMTQRRFGVIHPTGSFYIVAGNSGNNVGVFSINGTGSATTVTPIPGSPFATGATTANVLAVNQDGNFVFVGNRISRSVTTFLMGASTGQLTNLGSQPSNTLGTTGAINGIGYLPDAISSANIGGRVISEFGSATGQTIITIVSTDKEINRSVVVNPFGYYNFAGLPTGKTYTLAPLRKATTFTPENRVIVLSGNVADADFTASPE